MTALTVRRQDIPYMIAIVICGIITFWAGRYSAPEAVRVETPAPAPVASETRIVVVQAPAPAPIQVAVKEPEPPMALLPEVQTPVRQVTPVAPKASAAPVATVTPVVAQTQPEKIVLEETPIITNPYRKARTSQNPGF